MTGKTRITRLRPTGVPPFSSTVSIPKASQAVEKPLYKKTKKTVLPVFFLIPGAGPDVKGAEGGETEKFCPVPRKGQNFSVSR
ncbi:MAG: hypothetical protein IJC43_10475, partial [Clostridia bacterium]|nr:hypothetical protein [Clostridia bacterium]